MAAVFPYLGSLTYGFVYDDVGVIVDITSHEGWGGLWRAWVQSYWGNPDTGLYRPLVQFNYSLLWSLGGGHPVVFHLYAVALHVGAALAVWWLLRRSIQPVAALLGALLFAVHPVHVEAVANIVNTSEVVVTVLALAVLAVVWRGDAATAPDEAIAWRWAAGAAGLYFLALGAKESAATIPALAFVVWWGWPATHDGPTQAPTLAGVLRRGWRIWTAMTVALILMFIVRRLVLHGLTVRGDWIIGALRDATFGDRMWTMVAAWPTVAGLLLWPAHLRMHYGADAIPLEHGPTVGAIVALGAAVAMLALGTAIARRGDRRPLAAMLWVVFAYFPASNLLVATGQLLAERTLYLASVGVVMLAACAMDGAIVWLSTRVPARRASIIAGAPLAAAALLGAAKATDATIPWGDNYTLFLAGIDAAPRSSHPYWLMGNWYVTRGNHQRALVYLSKSYQLDPANSVVIFYYTRELHATGQGETELAVLRDATHRLPKSEEMRVMYRIALSEQRGADSVIADVRATPATDSVSLHWNTVFLAEAFERLGNRDSAFAAYRECLAKQPGNGLVRFEYAKMLLRAGTLDQSERQLALASNKPGVKPEAVLRVRAELALARGDTAQARASLAAAKAIAPDDTALARLQRQLGATAPAPPRTAMR